MRPPGWSAVLAGVLSACGPSEHVPPPAAPAPVAFMPASASPAAPLAAPRVVSGSEEEPPPPAADSLPATIELAIALLRKRDHRALIELLMDPDDLKKSQERGSGLDTLVREFGDSQKPQELLDMLMSIRGKASEVGRDGTEATFEGDPPLRFRCIQGRWFLRN